MKKLNYLFLLFVIAAIISCNNSGNKTTEDNNEANQENATNEAPAEKSSGKLTPNQIKPDEAIPVDELNEVVFAWQQVEEVYVTGYCDFFFDKGKIDNDVSLLYELDSDQVVIDCSMKEIYDEEFDKSIPVSIKGKIEGERFGRLQLIDCELVEKGIELPAKGKYIDPFVYGGENISVKDFYDSYYGWMDKEVSVIGYYKSTTTSTTDYGTTVRIDLSGETNEAKCRLKEDYEAPEIEDREGVIIKGIIKGDFFGEVLLEECELVNR
jgi:hypothetical protein